MPIHQLFVYEPLMNWPEVFASTSIQIPTFQGHMTNTYLSKANQLELFMFLTICRLKSNSYSTLMHVTRIKIQLITQKWPNIIQYSAEYYLIFALRSNTSTSNHHFLASPTVQLRLQRFEIRRGTLLRRSLHRKGFLNRKVLNFGAGILSWKLFYLLRLFNL